MREYQAVGKSVTRVDSLAKVTGKAVYAGDLARPGMLCGKILYSDRPHARIVRLETSRARALPGVAALVTAGDAPGRRFGIYLRDKVLFAEDRVRFIGEPVAAVAAVDEVTAAQALALIDVEYEDLPTLFDPSEAMAPDAFEIHPDYGQYQGIYPYVRYGNVCLDVRLACGSVEDGFAKADLIFEGTYRTAAVHQAPLETHACVAELDYGGRVTVYTGTQQLTVCHVETAQALGVPMSEVRIVPVSLGGGFGGKLKSHLEPIAALLARQAGKPVKLALTREEEFYTTHPRAPYEMRLRTGVKLDGTLVAKQVEILVDAGAYSDHTIGTATHAVTLVQGPYHIPNCAVRARVVYTNNPDWGCMRGYGAMEITFANEVQLDEIAGELGMDPAELRLKNLCREGEPTIATQELRSVYIRETMEAALAASGYWEKRGRLGPNRGIGLANLFHSTGFLSSSATVRVNEDATVTLITGITDVGSGTHTALCQIAAEVLGVAPECVHMGNPDSDTAPYDTGSIASRTIYDTGNAVRLATEEVRAQLCRVAAPLLNCAPEEVAVEFGQAYCRNHPDQRLAFADLVGKALYETSGPLLASASWLAAGPYPSMVGEGYGQGPAGTFLFGTHVAEVEVDPDTGKTSVVNYTACHDVGKALNPAALEGQIEGGVVQGIGMGLFEELVVERGAIRNASFVDYRLPTVLDVPPITALYVEEPDATGPFGAKGIGEPPIMPPAPAIANAIADATGVRLRSLPLSPERLYWALREAEGRFLSRD